jgi:hypothetical protein
MKRGWSKCGRKCTVEWWREKVEKRQDGSLVLCDSIVLSSAVATVVVATLKPRVRDGLQRPGPQNFALQSMRRIARVYAPAQYLRWRGRDGCGGRGVDNGWRRRLRKNHGSRRMQSSCQAFPLANAHAHSRPTQPCCETQTWP